MMAGMFALDLDSHVPSLVLKRINKYRNWDATQTF